MQIAQFVHRYPPALGGAEAYTARLCEYFSSCGDQVRVWTSSAIQLEEMWRPARNTAARSQSFPVRYGTYEEPEVVRFRPLNFAGRRHVLKALSLLPFSAWQCLTTPCNPVSLEMWREAGQYRAPLDAVHATAFPYSFPIMCGHRLARRRGVPFFITPFLHLGDLTDSKDRTRRQYTAPHLRWLLLQADGVFVQTEAEREMVLGMGLREDRVHLQGLGVEPDECTGGDRDAARNRWESKPGQAVVGHLSNNSQEKGTCELLQAAERLWKKGLEFQLVLAGPEMPNFQKFWNAYSPRGSIKRLGVLSEQQKRDFYAGIDLFALPSRTDSFGLVLLEAWANGKPNLVYRAGGPGQLVRDGLDGLQARCGDVAALANGLERLVHDRGLRHRLGESGLARIGSEFQWTDKLAMVRNVIETARLTRQAERRFVPRLELSDH
jgi:glycosyltransferase involved in cell wall biosynthesis